MTAPAGRLGYVTLPTSANPVRLVQKVAPIPQSAFRILVNRDNDRLNVVEAPTLTASQMPDFSQRFDPWRIVGLVVVPFEFSHHAQLRPPTTLPLVSPCCSFFSLSRSAHNPS